MNQVITVFLPCIALCIVSFSTSVYRVEFSFIYFDCVQTICSLQLQKEEFEGVVTVNVTIMLVLVTLFISVSSSLPRTDYVKMIEAYLMVSMFFPFFEVLLLTAVDMLM